MSLTLLGAENLTPIETLGKQEMFADGARYYLETLNWPVFPVSRNSKSPLIDGGCHSASIEWEQIEAWNRQFPSANLAVATGQRSGGIVVIDIDGPLGEQAWKLVRQIGWAGREPHCPQVRTSKGRHLYFRGRETANRVSSVLGKGIDVRADGGSAILPPSIHQSGIKYSWVVPPHVVTPPWLPPSISRLLSGEEAWPRFKPRKQIQPVHEDLPPDLERLVDMVLKAGEGERNHTLNVAAFLAAKTIAAGKASEHAVMDRLSHAARQIGLEPREIDGTIKSGLRSGERKL